MKPKLLILNGSLGGREGNTGAILGRCLTHLEPRAEIEYLVLGGAKEGFQKRSGGSASPDGRVDDRVFETDPKDWEPALRRANGFVFATGTYWDSWGSPLQSFLEEATEFESGDLWLGKPAAVLVTMHSVGGKAVLSRLQGVLSTLGILIPPMSGMTYSLANHFALQSEAARRVGFAADLWQLADLEVISHNLLEALKPPGEARNWRSWPVDEQDPRRRWLAP